MYPWVDACLTMSCAGLGGRCGDCELAARHSRGIGGGHWSQASSFPCAAEWCGRRRLRTSCQCRALASCCCCCCCDSGGCCSCPCACPRCPCHSYASADGACSQWSSSWAWNATRHDAPAHGGPPVAALHSCSLFPVHRCCRLNATRHPHLRILFECRAACGRNCRIFAGKHAASQSSISGQGTVWWNDSKRSRVHTRRTAARVEGYRQEQHASRQEGEQRQGRGELACQHACGVHVRPHHKHANSTDAVEGGFAHGQSTQTGRAAFLDCR